MNQSQSNRVCAVVVTFNRCALLRECLKALQEQSRAVDHILVVDNASTDDTRAMLAREFADLEVLALEHNSGGAGGFHDGMKHAFEAGYDWLWLMDDDGTPAPDCLEKLLEHADPKRTLLPILRDELGRPYGINTEKEGIAPRLAEQGIPVIGPFLFTFVGPLVPREAVKRLGLPIKEFFIWLDDWEFGMRINADKELELMAVPAAIFHHQPGGKTRQAKFMGRTSVRMEQPAWKIYYGTRNGLYIIAHARRNVRQIPAFFLNELKLMLGDWAYEPQRWQRTAMRLRGVRDGALGRLGKRV